MPEHVTTDPACCYHRPIRGLFARWRDRRARGRSCITCMLARGVTLHLAVDDRAWREYQPSRG